MLPLTEMLGPSGPLVATRQGDPSSQADRIRSWIFWLIGMVVPSCASMSGADNRAPGLSASSGDETMKYALYAIGGGVTISPPGSDGPPTKWKRPAGPAASSRGNRDAGSAALQLEVGVRVLAGVRGR